MYLLLSSTATIKLTVKEFRERNKMPQSCFCVPVSPLYLGGNILSRRWRLFCCVPVSPFYILGEHPDKEAEAVLAKQSGDLGGSLFPVIIGGGPRHISLISLHCNEVQRLFFTHRHNTDFSVLLFILFQILKSEGLAAGEEEDAGEEGDEEECAGFSDHLIKNMVKR